MSFLLINPYGILYDIRKWDLRVDLKWTLRGSQKLIRAIVLNPNGATGIFDRQMTNNVNCKCWWEIMLNLKFETSICEQFWNNNKAIAFSGNHGKTHGNIPNLTVLTMPHGPWENLTASAIWYKTIITEQTITAEFQC